MPLLLQARGVNSAAASSARWRTTYLIEYFATRDDDNEHLSAKSAISHGHRKDSSNNTFIGLRVLNASYDLAYFEFSDVAADFSSMSRRLATSYASEHGAAVH